MDSSRLNDWVQIFGIFALVASLIFVGLQLRQSQEIAEFEGFTAGANRNMTFQSLVVDHADIWLKGCLGEELQPEEQVKFAGMHRAYITNSFAQWQRLQQGEFSSQAAHVSVTRMAINFHRFPGLKAAEDARMDWLGEEGKFRGGGVSEWRALVNEEMMRLALEDPDPEIDVRWCGL